MRVSENRWLPWNYLLHIADICRNAIYEGDGRIILTVPPRHGKSTFISHWLPTWFLELYSYKNVMLATYQSEFARTWGRKVRNTIDANPHILNVRISKDSYAANKFNTTNEGGMIASGLDGGFTGKGGDLLIIDDPVKNHKDANSILFRQTQKDWFDWVIDTRLEPKATIIILMTRWHHDDLAGWLLRDSPEPWRLINFPAICEYPDEIGRKPGDALCPERYDVKALNKKRRNKQVWTSLYQQRPTVQEGSVWNTKWWRYYDEDPKEKAKEMSWLVQSWDMSFKDEEDSDYVVGQIWGSKNDRYYLIDETRGQWGFAETLRKVLMFSTKWDNTSQKFIESAANGIGIESMLRSKLDDIVLVQPQGSKLERAQASQPEIEAGSVFLPNPSDDNPFAQKHNADTGEDFNWVKDFIEECKLFPKGQFDDRVDAASQALLQLMGEESDSILITELDF